MEWWLRQFEGYMIIILMRSTSTVGCWLLVVIIAQVHIHIISTVRGPVDAIRESLIKGPIFSFEKLSREQRHKSSQWWGSATPIICIIFTFNCLIVLWLRPTTEWPSQLTQQQRQTSCCGVYSSFVAGTQHPFTDEELFLQYEKKKRERRKVLKKLTLIAQGQGKNLCCSFHTPSLCVHK